MEDLFYRVEYRSGKTFVDICYARSEEEARMYISWLTKHEEEARMYISWLTKHEDEKKPHYYCLWQEGFGYDVDSELVTQFDHFGVEIPKKLQDLGWEYDSNNHPRLLTEDDEDCSICKEVKAKEIKKWEDTH